MAPHMSACRVCIHSAPKRPSTITLRADRVKLHNKFSIPPKETPRFSSTHATSSTEFRFCSSQTLKRSHRRHRATENAIPIVSYRNHEVSGFCVYRVTDYLQYQTSPFVYSGPDTMTKFYDHIMQESQVISDILSKQVDMLPLTKEQTANYSGRKSACCSDHQQCQLRPVILPTTSQPSVSARLTTYDRPHPAFHRRSFRRAMSHSSAISHQ